MCMMLESLNSWGRVCTFPEWSVHVSQVSKESRTAWLEHFCTLLPEWNGARPIEICMAALPTSSSKMGMSRSGLTSTSLDCLVVDGWWSIQYAIQVFWPSSNISFRWWVLHHLCWAWAIYLMMVVHPRILESRRSVPCRVCQYSLVFQQLVVSETNILELATSKKYKNKK